jgi:hypothetical protein
MNMLVKDAKELIGGLSDASKMPGDSYNLNAKDCKTGAKLVKIPGSVCAECYALGGNYTRYEVVPIAQARRLERLENPGWVKAMAKLTSKGEPFRWFDSGDVQSLSMLIKIVAVAMLNPQQKYWLPTKEYSIVTEYRKRGGFEPKNLAFRVSAPKIDQRLPDAWGTSSMVITPGTKVGPDVFICDAAHTMKNGRKVETITKENKSLLGHCGDCRACWNPNNKVTAYPIH